MKKQEFVPMTDVEIREENRELVESILAGILVLVLGFVVYLLVR